MTQENNSRPLKSDKVIPFPDIKLINDVKMINLAHVAFRFGLCDKVLESSLRKFAQQDGLSGVMYENNAGTIYCSAVAVVQFGCVFNQDVTILDLEFIIRLLDGPAAKVGTA